MRSYRAGSLSAATQVKLLSPEIIHIALGQGFHILETNIGTHENGERATDVSGSEYVAGKRIVNIGTWENRNVPSRSFQRAEKVMRKYGVSVVGLIHIRGVGRVMPVELRIRVTLEGVSSLTQRDEVCHAIH